MPKAIDITGKRFNRWLVKSRTEERASGGSLMWLCVCDCGSEKSVKSSDLIRGASKSCGCLQKEALGLRLKHGHNVGGQSRTYQTWRSMLRRCSDVKHKHYPIYGGKGIIVCDRWRKFENFLVDMSERPEGKTLDRKDSSGNYEPSNCKWSTPKEQANNMSRNRYLTYNGKKQTVSQWADELNIPYNTLIGRVRRGWTTERSLTT